MESQYIRYNWIVPTAENDKPLVFWNLCFTDHLVFKGILFIAILLFSHVVSLLYFNYFHCYIVVFSCCLFIVFFRAQQGPKNRIFQNQSIDNSFLSYHKIF